MTRAFVMSRMLRRLVARMEAAMWDLSAAQVPFACSRNRSGRALPTLQAEGWLSMAVVRVWFRAEAAVPAHRQQHAVAHL